MVAKLLIDKGADVNTRTNNGKIPVFIAAEKGHADALQALHEVGAEINIGYYFQFVKTELTI